MTRRASLMLAAAAGALATALAGGIASAAIPDGNGVFTGCRLKATGTVRLIDPSLPQSSVLSHCTSVEAVFSWNAGGPKGPAGDKGPTGRWGQGPDGGGSDHPARREAA